MVKWQEISHLLMIIVEVLVKLVDKPAKSDGDFNKRIQGHILVGLLLGYLILVIVKV